MLKRFFPLWGAFGAFALACLLFSCSSPSPTVYVSTIDRAHLLEKVQPLESAPEMPSRSTWTAEPFSRR